MILDRLLERWKSGVPFSENGKLGGQLSHVDRFGRRMYLLKPSRFMNLSGDPVQSVSHYYKVGRPNILVICDDVNLPFGHVRLRGKGGAGGHNGLKDIERALGGADYVRMRVGVGGGQPGRNLTGHVLGDFPDSEARRLNDLFDHCCRAIETVFSRGVSVAMSQYNGNVFPEPEEAGPGRPEVEQQPEKRR